MEQEQSNSSQGFLALIVEFMTECNDYGDIILFATILQKLNLRIRKETGELTFH